MGKKKDDNPPSFLSGEDEKLWRKIASTTKPLSEKDRNRVESVEITATPKQPEKTPARPENKSQNSSSSAARKPKTPAISHKPALADIDRKKVRKIATDQIDIQATLDLHGYRQEQAHTALKGFIRSCQSQNFRYVLVITGKGAPKKSGSSFWDEPEPGVLRRNVPLWLSDPDLRDCVVGYTNAHPKHGGDGALYVQLRRLNKLSSKNRK